MKTNIIFKVMKRLNYKYFIILLITSNFIIYNILYSQCDPGCDPGPQCTTYGGCGPSPGVDFPRCKLRDDRGEHFTVSQWRTDGTFIRDVTTGLSIRAFNMITDNNGKYYVTNDSNIVVLDQNFNFLGTICNGLHEVRTILFDNALNLYAADSTRIWKFDHEGNFISSYLHHRVEYIDLKADQCTMLWSNEFLTPIESYDVCANKPLPPFSTSSSELKEPTQFKIRPNGEVIIIDNNVNHAFIRRLDSSGNSMQIYDAPVRDNWVCIGLDPDETSFWSVDGTAYAYKFDIESGEILLSFFIGGELGANNFSVTFNNNENTLIPAHTVNLTALIEGFYNDVSNEMTGDKVKIYLRNIYPPYSMVDSSDSELNLDGNGTYNFANASDGIPYYIVIKHRNSIETWSSEQIMFTEGTLLSYDFTNSGKNAYKDNMVLKGKRWCIYSGDVDQDGIIDATDVSFIYNDAYSHVEGYVSTDVNGDSIVDQADIEIAYNNALNIISVLRPFEVKPQPVLDLEKIMNLDKEKIPEVIENTDSEKEDQNDETVPEER